MKQKSFHIPFSSKTTYEKFKKSAKVKGLILPVAISEAMELWMAMNKGKTKKEIIITEEQKRKIREAREKRGIEDKATIEHFDR